MTDELEIAELRQKCIEHPRWASDRIQELEKRIDWALRVKQAGMVGYVPDMLQGNFEYLDVELLKNSSFTLRSFVEAVEREEGR